jgi:hypothetical protein
VENRYFIPVPVFGHQKHLTGSRDHGIVSPQVECPMNVPTQRTAVNAGQSLKQNVGFLNAAVLNERWVHVQQCRMALCCNRVTWKAVQSGLFLHQGHLEGCAEQLFVAL